MCLYETRVFRHTLIRFEKTSKNRELHYSFVQVCSKELLCHYFWDFYFEISGCGGLLNRSLKFVVKARASRIWSLLKIIYIKSICKSGGGGGKSSKAVKELLCTPSQSFFGSGNWHRYKALQVVNNCLLMAFYTLSANKLFFKGPKRSIQKSFWAVLHWAWFL